MTNFLIRGSFWFRKRSFIRIAQRTFVMLMPIATIGAYFKLIRECFFSPDGLLYNIFNFDINMSNQIWKLGNAMCEAMIQVTFGIFGIYAAYFSAMFTARIYKKDATMAGMTSVVVLTFCSYLAATNLGSGQQITFYSRILSINGVLLALVIGYLVGQVFRYLGSEYVHVKNEHLEIIQQRILRSLKPTLVTLFVGFIFGFILYYFKIKLLDASFTKNLITQIRDSNDLRVIVPFTMLASLSWWFGIGFPIGSLSHASSSADALANLNTALQSGSSHVPYPFLGSSLIQGYGLIGDTAIVFSLTIALLLFNQDKEIEKISKYNVLPAAFGMKSGFAVGLPVLLNPTFFIPVLMIPVINELLAAGAIAMHWIMPSVYPVFQGVPGILFSFIGTNGNWASFIFTILLFIVDIIIFVPFVRIGMHVNEELKKYDKAEI